MDIDTLAIRTLNDEELNAFKTQAKSLMKRTVKHMVQKRTYTFRKQMDHLIKDSLIFMNYYLETNGTDMTEQELEEAYLVNAKVMEALDAKRLN